MSRPGLLLTLPILERMRVVEGWLAVEEADLLIAALSRALADMPNAQAVVEVGSYLGKSTTVLGSVLRALAPGCRMHAIDPHEGEVGSVETGLTKTPPTLERFMQTLRDADLTHLVETVRCRSYETEWDLPIRFLFIDGLHDYMNVSRDLGHFEPWLVPGAYVAFHDYADYYPGVVKLVDELLASGRYEYVERVRSMIVIRRMPNQALDDPSERPAHVGRSRPSRPSIAQVVVPRSHSTGWAGIWTRPGSARMSASARGA